MKHTRILAALCAALMAVSLAACGGKPENPGSSPSSGDAGSAPSTTAESTTTGATDDTQAEGSTTGNASTSKNGTTKSTSKTAGTASEVKKDITIKKGSKPMENGLNFGGKTFTMTLWSAPETSTKRTIQAFETKFNCKINIKVFSFNTFNSQVSAHVAAGNKADISQMHGSMFPTGAITNLYQPLEDVITTADLYNSKNMKAGGIDLEKSKGFAWNNHLYGVCGYYSINPYLIFYNKKMFQDAGLEDPRTLYEQNKWTWDKLIEMGKDVTDPKTGIYLADASFREKFIVQANDASYVKYENNVPKENLTDPKVYNGLKLLQNICVGQNKIVNTEVGGGTDPEPFYNGNVYMYAQESFAYYNFAKAIPSKAAFGRSLNNLGIVPVPLGPDNKSGAYPTGWLTSYCSGRGSDPRVAVAWARFSSYYVDPVKPEISFSDKDNKLIESLIKTVSYPNYGFADSSITADTISHNIEGAVMRGEDIAKVLNTWRNPLQNCITATLSEQG